MDYQKIYNNLITKRLNEILPENVYSEKHHIIPKCVGGNNDKSNLVRLTAREHYIAHLLLAKIHNTFGLYAAVIYMQSGRFENRKFKFNSHLYQKLREEFAKKLSKRNKGKKFWLGKHHSEESKKRISEFRKGKIHSEETKRKMSEARKGNTYNLGKKRSKEIRSKISAIRSEVNRNRHWFNNGIKNVFVKECPDGFVKGMLKRKSI